MNRNVATCIPVFQFESTNEIEGAFSSTQYLTLEHAKKLYWHFIRCYFFVCTFFWNACHGNRYNQAVLCGLILIDTITGPKTINDFYSLSCHFYFNCRDFNAQFRWEYKISADLQTGFWYEITTFKTIVNTTDFNVLLHRCKLNK